MQNKRVQWSQKDLPNIINALKEGNVLVGTSDTVFGLLALPTQEGFAALNSIKGRSEKPYLIITGSPENAVALCEPANQQDLLDCMRAFWPGPVTMIVRAEESVPAYMQSKDNTIAIRVPEHAGFKMLLKHIPHLFSTSANLAGQPVPHSADDLHPSIIDQCALVITDQESRDTSLVPSTIIDCTQKPFKVVREGAITLDELKKRCPTSF